MSHCMGCPLYEMGVCEPRTDGPFDYASDVQLLNLRRFTIRDEPDLPLTVLEEDDGEEATESMRLSLLGSALLIHVEINEALAEQSPEDVSWMDDPGPDAEDEFWMGLEDDPDLPLWEEFGPEEDLSDPEVRIGLSEAEFVHEAAAAAVLIALAEVAVQPDSDEVDEIVVTQLAAARTYWHFGMHPPGCPDLTLVMAIARTLVQIDNRRIHPVRNDIVVPGRPTHF